MRKLLWLFLLFPFCHLAHAQLTGPVYPVGPITAGNCVKWEAYGFAADSGGPCGGTGAPGGSSYSLQYNNVGAFGGLLPGATGQYCLNWTSLTAAPTLVTCASGGMVYPGAGIPNSTGTGWGTSYSTSGTGSVALTTSPVLTTPNLGVPSAISLVNATALTLPVGAINATGTPSATTFLAGNGTWATPSASATSIVPGTTTITGATAPCLIDNSSGTVMGCAALGAGLSITGSTLVTTQALNAQVGTTYTIAATDAGKLLTFNNVAAIAVTLPVATTSGFGAGFGFSVQNIGGGTVNITPTTSTINGAATFVIPANTGCSVVSDGTNYQVGACTATAAQIAALSSGIAVTPNCADKINTVTSTAYTIAAPTNGALTQTAGGTLAATTYYVKSTWTTASGETVGATETSLAVLVDNVLNVAAPASPPANATGWNVYVSTATGTETRQNSTPIGTATAWVEPTTGLVAGSALPSANTSGQFTVNLPVGCTPYTGQKLLLIIQSASGGTLTYLPGSYLTGATAGAWPSASVAASKDDHFALVYDGYLATPGWTLAAYNLGL